MIREIEIIGYRSCLNTQFHPHPHLSVLIGPNGTGKTTILNAIALLKNLLNEDHGYRPRSEKVQTARSELRVTFFSGRQVVRFRADIDSYTDENNRDVIVRSRQRWQVPEIHGRRKWVELPLFAPHRFASGFRLFPHSYLLSQEREYRIVFGSGSSAEARILRPVLAAAARVSRLLSGLHYYSASQFTNPGSCPVSIELEEGRLVNRPIRARQHLALLSDLYTQYKAKNTKLYGQFLEIIGPRGLHLVDRIDFKEISTSAVDYSVRSGGRIRKLRRERRLVIPQFTIGRHVLSPNQLSEGTFRTITLLFYLITQSSSILLLEEPEVCVHHGLLSGIVELIKNYATRKQIILSSHSDFVLDHVKPENVFKVSTAGNKGTIVSSVPSSMSSKEFSALRQYLSTEGNLGEYWRHGGLEE